MGGFRQIQGCRLGWMQLAEPAGRPPLQHQLGGPAGMEQRLIAEHAILHRQLQAGERLLQHPPGLEVASWSRLAAGAPALSPPLAADHPHQQIAATAVSAVEHLADLKGPEAALAALQVAAGRRQQFVVEVVAQMAVVGQQGIGQGQTPLGGRHQGEAAGLLQAGSAESPAQPALGLLLGFEAARFDRIRQMAGELVVAHQARHLLDQVDLAAQVDRPGGGHLHLPALLIGRGLQLAAQGLQGAGDALVAQVLRLAVHQHRAQQVVQGIAAQQQRLSGLAGALMQPAAFHRGTAELDQQGAGPIGSGQGGLPRQALFKTAAGLGAQAHAAGRLPHQLRREHGRLQPDRARSLMHGFRRAAHHASQGDRLIGVGHRQRRGRELMLCPIEAGEGLAIAPLAQAETAGIGAAAAEGRQPVAVEGMQRLAGFQHHQVGDVHHVVDRPHAGLLQALAQPQGRGTHLQAAEGRDAEQPPGLDRHLAVGAAAQGLHRLGGRWHRSEPGAAAAEGGHLPGDALHRQAVGAVGGDRQLQHLVIEAEARPHRAAQGRHLIEQLVQNGDAVRAVAQPQLGEGADHAAAGHSAQLGRLDREIHRRQGGAHQGHGHVDAGAHIGGTADDLQRFSGSHLHLADAQLGGVGMGLAVADIAHHHSGSLGRQILDRIHLEAGDRQALRQGLDRQIERIACGAAHQLLQPLVRDAHGSDPIGKGGS